MRPLREIAAVTWAERCWPDAHEYGIEVATRALAEQAADQAGVYLAQKADCLACRGTGRMQMRKREGDPLEEFDCPVCSLEFKILAEGGSKTSAAGARTPPEFPLCVTPQSVMHITV